MARRKPNPWPFTSKSLSARNTTPAHGGIAAHSKAGRRSPSKSRVSEGSAKRPAPVDIDEAKLAAHFKKGGTLAEFLKLNPSDREAGSQARGLTPAGRARLLKKHIEWVEQIERGGRKLSAGELKILRQRFGAEARRKNPVGGEVTDRAKRYRAQKNVTGPRKCVICGSTRNLDVMHLSGDESDGAQKNLAYGCRSCNATLGAAFKRIGAGRPTNQYNPARGAVPTFAQYSWAVSQGGPNGHHWHGGAHDEAGAVIHATPKHKRIEYARRIAEDKGVRARARDDERWNSAASSGIPPNRGFGGRDFRPAPDYAAKVDAINDQLARLSITSKKWRELHARKSALLKKVAAEYRKNPAGAAAAGYEEFHGEPSSKFVTVRERAHVHKYLSGAGTLKRLVVASIDGRASVVVTFDGKTLLAFNEQKNQLFVVGGDQSVDLQDFGIDPKRAHELETLGRITSLDYATVKTHLGDEGGDAVYRHKLRTTNENGRHVTVRIARYPDLIYRVRDTRLEFSGGSYEIRAEGIDL